MNEPNRDQENKLTEVESDGLFPSEPETRRENPYLRKNREKAAQAAKAEKAKQKKEKKPRSAVEPPADAQESTKDPSPNPIQDPDDTPARRRTFSDFIFEHIKLITAVLTCLCILSLVIITDVTGWVEDIKMKQEQKDKMPLSLAHVRALCDRGQNIIWSDMTAYVRFDTDVTDTSVTWKFKVVNTDLKNAELELWISGVNTALTPSYVYLYDLMSGERIDLNKENLDLFLDKLE